MAVDQNRDAIPKLIEIVKRYPVIYNPRMKEYSDNEAKGRIWEEIAAECGLDSGEKAKKHWETILHRYRFFLRHVPCIGQKPWQLHRALQYILPFMKNGMYLYNQKMYMYNQIKDSKLNEEGEEVEQLKTEEILPNVKNADPLTNDEEKEEAEEVEETPRARKRRRVKSCSGNRVHEIVKCGESVASDVSKAEDKNGIDSLKLFFDSMFSITRNLPPKLQRSVKRSLFEAVTEAEESHENSAISKKRKCQKSGESCNQQLNDSFAVEEDENDA